MSFLASFALGGLKEYNNLKEQERAALAKKAADEKAAEAELALFKKKEDYKAQKAAEEADRVADAARQKESGEIAQLWGVVSQKKEEYTSRGITNRFVTVDPVAKTIIDEEVNTPTNLEVWANNWNKNNADSKKTAVVVPVADGMPTINFIDKTVPKEKKGLTAEEIKPKIDDFNNNEGKQSNRLAYKKPLNDGTFEFAIVPLPEGKNHEDYDDNGIALGPNYIHYQILGKDDGKETSKHGRIHPLVPGLDISGRTNRDKLKRGETFLYLPRPRGTTNTQVANDDLINFRREYRVGQDDSFVQRIIDNKDTFPQAYNTMVDTVRVMIDNWEDAHTNKEGGASVKKDITKVHPWLGDLADQDLQINALFKDGSRATKTMNRSVGEPINAPVIVDQNGDTITYLRPNLASSSFVVDTPEGKVYDESFKGTLFRLAEKSGLDTVAPFDLLDGAIYKGVGGPLAAEKAYGALTRGEALFAGRTFIGERGDSAAVQMPFIGSEPQKAIKAQLSHFNGHYDRIGAVAFMMPDTDLDSLYAGMSGAGLEPEDVFSRVSGLPKVTYKEVTKRNSDSEDMIAIADRSLDLLEGGAQAGILGQVSKMTAIGNELVDKVLPTLVGKDEAAQSAINNLSAEYQNAQNMPDSQAKVDALLRLNLRILSYRKASLLDPNGRLSDADREAADDALGFAGIFVATELIETNVREVKRIAEYSRDTTKAYMSGNPSLILASRVYQSLSPERFTSANAVVAVPTTESVATETETSSVVTDRLNRANQGKTEGETPAGETDSNQPKVIKF